MFELFVAFFIALFAFFAIAAVVGHVLLLGAMMRTPVADEAAEPPPQPERLPLRLAA
jgi:hypothetical protein